MGILDNNTIQPSIYEATKYLLESGDLDTFEDQVSQRSLSHPLVTLSTYCFCEYIVVFRDSILQDVKYYLRSPISRSWIVYTIQLRDSYFIISRKTDVRESPVEDQGPFRWGGSVRNVYTTHERAEDLQEMFQETCKSSQTWCKKDFGTSK